MSEPVKVLLSHRCCGCPGRPGPHWEMFIPIDGPVTDCPRRCLPVAGLGAVPSPQQREVALRKLGFRLAVDSDPDVVWDWQESDTSGAHGHRVRVSLIASAAVVPITEGGEPDADL